MNVPRLLLVLALTATLSAGAISDEDDEAPLGDVPLGDDLPLSASEVLDKIDKALFYPDAQEGLAGYECDASVTTSSTGSSTGGLRPDETKATPLAHVSVDASTGTKEWKNASGEQIAVGAWAPSCGPWTLTNVMQVATELFLSPLTKRFTEATWTREVEEKASGWRLVLTPKQAIGKEEPFFLRPAVTRIELSLGLDGVPTRGVLGLDQGPIQEDGEIEFEFVDVGTKKRIAAIKTSLTSANLRIRPVLRFGFEEQSGFLMPESVIFSVPSGDLSPTMGRMMGGSMPSALLFRNYAVKKASPDAE